ncbi:plasmid mobilization relaxosome protein MobC [Pseudogemmobacter bohemicus]|uniref:plasmid mobilization relaxosome protein MobC n=1 Tax=Pseudogemmobacter bohemicus TaxID=2250708 RepID=UPI000DD2C734|nr:plasmid mobilization relaxosome protein MobC [Pseudogemmobacter bohemicus]
MPPTRRLTDQERQEIVRERAMGVSVGVMAARFAVSEKTVYNVLSHGRQARSANGSRTRVLTMRVSERDLRAFDAALSRHGLDHRSDALRRLVACASDLLSPDEDMAEQLRGLGAAMNRVGNNINQIARRLNEGRVRGEQAVLTGSEKAEIRALAGLVFTIADQVQEMSRNRRATLKLEVDKALAPLIREARDGAR